MCYYCCREIKFQAACYGVFVVVLWWWCYCCFCWGGGAIVGFGGVGVRCDVGDRCSMVWRERGGVCLLCFIFFCHTSTNVLGRSSSGRRVVGCSSLCSCRRCCCRFWWWWWWWCLLLLCALIWFGLVMARLLWRGVLSVPCFVVLVADSTARRGCPSSIR